MAGYAPPSAEGEKFQEVDEVEEQETDPWQAEGGDPWSPWEGDEETGWSEADWARWIAGGTGSPSTPEAPPGWESIPRIQPVGSAGRGATRNYAPTHWGNAAA